MHWQVSGLEPVRGLSGDAGSHFYRLLSGPQGAQRSQYPRETFPFSLQVQRDEGPKVLWVIPADGLPRNCLPRDPPRNYHSGTDLARVCYGRK
jgi:hypothetical protein